MQKLLIKFLSFFCLLLMSLNSPLLMAQSGTRLGEFFDQLKTFQAEFIQIQFDEYGEVSQRSEGELWVQRPGRFRWDYKQPFAQMMLGKEGSFWLYDEDLEQLTIRKIDQAMASSPLLMLSSDVAIEQLFKIVSIRHEGAYHWYELIARSAEASFETFRMALDDAGNLIEMELVDGMSQRILVSFSDVQINRAIDSKVFDFEVPAGVDVIGELP
ncbi:MAG: outer membrane lipoprotein chaperone LolA [Gammaproteobacteria bacterium]|nr:outer membrane lipoprotein chaperone LolA [Gammaproteobacteria bacterium]